jgi:hypothetical protein
MPGEQPASQQKSERVMKISYGEKDSSMNEAAFS